MCGLFRSAQHDHSTTVPKTHFSRCHPVDQGVSLFDGADGDLSTFQTSATVAAVQSLHLRRDIDQSVAACHHLIGYRVRWTQAVNLPPPKCTYRENCCSGSSVLPGNTYKLCT